MKRARTVVIIVVVGATVIAGFYAFSKRSVEAPVIRETQTMSNLSITSPIFKDNENIPAKYTCDGEDESPPLEIAGVPEGAKSLVLIMDDPDATGGRTWDHWVIFNLQPTTVNIQQGEEPMGVSGKNSWGKTGYGGPCPGSGTHRYFFKLYALDTVLNLPAGSERKDVEKAMEGHVLDKTEIIGLYKRQQA